MKLKNFLGVSGGVFSIFLVMSLLLVFTASPVLALFTNGDFNNGFTGWTKAKFINPGLDTSPIPFTGANINRNAGGTDRTYIRGPFAELSQVDGRTGGVLHYPRYGEYCAVINFEGNGRNANSLMQQTTATAGDVQADGKIHIGFAWAAVVQNPQHNAHQQPYIWVGLKNITKGTTLYQEFYFAGSNAIWQNAPYNVQFTNWQVKDIAPDITALGEGDIIELEAVAAGCSASGHWGYLYVDGFAAKAPERLPGADVYPTITDSPDPVTAGQNVTYTIKISNDGPDPANNVVVTDNLPASLTFVSTDLAAGQYTVNGQTLACNLGTINNGSFIQFSVTARVNSAATPINNTVSVTNTVADPNTQNNSSTTVTTVTQNSTPVVNAGLDRTVEQTSPQGTQVTLNGSASDDGLYQPLTYTWAWPGGSATGASPTVSLTPGMTTITLSAYDGQLTGTDTVNITVSDTTAPAISAPANITTECTSRDGATVSLGTATATDICDPAPVISNNAPSVFPLGVTNVTWKARDASGNEATAIQAVTITDTTPPAITAPANVTAEMTSPAGATVNLGTPTVSDVCDANPTVSNNAPAVFPMGTTSVTWIATDASGNSASAAQAVTVRDTIAPFITAPANIIAEMTGPAGATITNLGTPAVFDVADPAPVVSNDTYSLTVDQQHTNLSYWFHCGASGAKQAAQYFTPGVTGKLGEIQLYLAVNSPSMTVAVFDAPLSWPVGGIFPGTPLATVTNTPSGSEGWKSFNFNSPATLTAGHQYAFVISSTTGTIWFQGSYYYPGGNIWWSDNVPNPSTDMSFKTSMDTTMTNFPQGVTTVTWTATDASGNTASAVQTVTVQDTIAPAITGAATTSPNANSWYNSDVTVHFVATDGGAGIDSVTPDVILSSDGTGQSVTGTAIDKSGNRATYTVTGLNIDKTAPVITYTRTTANGAGWNNTDVTVTFTGTDVLSGINSVTPPVTLTGEGADQVASGTATDKAGNTASVNVNNINIDKTLPALTFGAASPAANAAGWNNTDVTIPFAAADALSGVASTSPSGQVVLTSEGQAVTGAVTVTDKAGNTASFTTPAYNIDKTKPEIAGSRTPGANTYGWNNGDVAAHFTASDSLSGISSLTPDTVVSTEAANQSVTGTAVDVAGNTATATVININIDKTAPTIFGAATTQPNAAGWYKSSVTVHFTSADGLSGVASTTPDTVLSAEGAGQSVPGTVADKAGNSASTSVGNLNIDLTKPTLVFAAATTQPNSKGWYNADVTVPFTANDNLSGVASTSPVGQIVISSESEAASGLVTVTDVAGNTRTFTTPLYKIDKTKPGLTFAATSPAPNAAGWNNTDATVAYTAGDSLSGVGSAVPATPLSFTSEGNNLTQTVTVTDNADNVATFTSQVVKIDKTLPTITAARTAPNPNGWNNGNVVVTFTGADNLSGVNTLTGPITVSAEGANQAVNGTVVDVAGNSASITMSNINIDKTKPNLAIASPVAKDYYTNESFTVGFTTGDTLSGVFTTTATIGARTVANGETINLAAMAGSNTLTVTVTDKAGNVQSASVTFYVIMSATIDLDPNTLNLKSNSDKNAFICYIELPAGYDVNQINVSSVKLNVKGVLIAAQTSPTSVGNYDVDAFQDRMVKFDRAQIIAALNGTTGDISMTVTGQLNDTRKFSGGDVIKVTNPGK